MHPSPLVLIWLWVAQVTKEAREPTLGSWCRLAAWTKVTAGTSQEDLVPDVITSPTQPLSCPGH